MTSTSTTTSTTSTTTTTTTSTTSTTTTTSTTLPPNEAPAAADDEATTNEDNSVTVDVTANDSDPNGNLDQGSVAIVDGPSFGVATVNSPVRYVPFENFFGDDSFTYEVCDTDGLCDRATVTMTVVAVNDPPTVGDDEVTLDEDTSVVIDVLSNASDVDSALDAASVSITTPPVIGEVDIGADGTLTYTPNPDAFGVDSFAYEVCDSEGACGGGSIEVAVTQVTDPPVAADDLTSTDEDSPVVISVLSNDGTLDLPLVPGSVVATVGPSFGTAVPVGDGTVRYTPDADFSGEDAFGYEVCNAEALCDDATVTVDVVPVNDPPVAGDDEASTDEDTPVVVDVLGNDADVDSALDPASVVVMVAPVSGAAVPVGDGTVAYTPSADFFGSDAFEYEVCDVEGLCDTATVMVDVFPVNDAPTAADDVASTDEDTAVVVDVLGNDSDVDSALDPASVVVMVAPVSGAAVLVGDGTVAYTPSADFFGSDAFEYEACDVEGLCDTAIVAGTCQ